MKVEEGRGVEDRSGLKESSDLLLVFFLCLLRTNFNPLSLVIAKTKVGLLKVSALDLNDLNSEICVFVLCFVCLRIRQIAFSISINPILP